MNIIGYLVTLANIQNFAGNDGPLQDLSVRTSQVGVLANELKNYHGFNIEPFRDSGFYRVGNVGKYLSKNLRDYLFNGNVDPKDEGLIITLKFSKKEQFKSSEGYDGARTFTMPQGMVLDENQQGNGFGSQEALNFDNHLRSARSVEAH